MIKFLIILTLVVSGCGIAQDISKKCGGAGEVICKSIFGYNQQEIDRLRDRMDQDDAMDAETEMVLQQQIDNLQAQLTEIELNESIVEFIDPCGDDIGYYDEVILRTSENKLVAYFQQGAQRFLAILPAGNYVTTDHQSCHFTIDANGNLF